MAIRGGDGSIILTTKVDTSGINKGSLSIRSALQSVDTTVKKVQNSFSAFREQKVTLQSLNETIKIQQGVLDSLNSQYAKLVASGNMNSTQAQKLKAEIKEETVAMKELQSAAQTLGEKGSASINKISLAMKSLLSYFIGIQTIFKAINFSGEAAKFATQTEASVQRLVDIYGESAQSVGDFIDANARAIGMSKSASASIAATYGNLLSIWADQETNAQLTNNLLNQTAVIASKTGRTTTDVAERIRSGLLGNTEAIEDLGINVNIKTIEITDAFKRIADGRSWEQLNAYEQSQVRTLAILEQSTKKYGTTVAQTSATVRNQYQAAYEDFKNTWGQVVNKVLIPVLKVLTQIFNIATKGLQIIAGLTGKTIDTNSAFLSQEEAIGGAVDNQEALTDAVKGTNKELKKSLANFDEINILSQDTAKSSDSGATGAGASGGVGGIGDLGLDYDNSFVEKISGDMAAIMAIVGGALAAVGLLLIFFGHPFWGISFIIVGASAFGVSMATLSSEDQVTPITEELMKILAIAGTALAALGLILLFSGSWQWGIAFLVAGAAALGVAIVATENGNVTKEAEEMLINVMTVAGAAMLALGVILLCFGVVSPLSIGLVVAGAASLAGAIVLNPKLVFENVSKFFKDNAGLIVGISLALLVLGILLCVCGIVTPLSIGMIVAGAVGLVAELALNWNYLVTTITDFFNQNAGLIAGIAVALLILGVLILLTGVGTPLGIGLIIAGAGALGVMAATLDWTYLVTEIKNFFKENAGLISGIAAALVIIGVILLLTGVGIPLAIGMIIAGGALLATEAVLNWDYLTTEIKNFFKKNAELITGVATALLVLGIILCCVGFINPLSIGLIIAGGALLVTEVALNWNKLPEEIKNTLTIITNIISGFSLALGIILLITGNFVVGIPLILAGLGGLYVANNANNLFGNGLADMVSNELSQVESVAMREVDSINSILSNTGNVSLSSSSYKIPKLARGAVIPPNKEFLAILGDQKSGTNIEAPLETIKQAFKEEVALMSQSPTESVTNINFTGNLAQLARILKPQIERETLRTGKKLITGGANY